MMKQFEIMEAARQQIIAQLKLADLPYQIDGAEFGVYVTVKDGDTEIDVPMTIKAAAHRYADTEKAKAYDLAAAAEEYDFTVKAREDAKQARLAEKARKDAEKARAKAQRDAVKAAKKAKREVAKTDAEDDSVEQ
jgi:uncharacterized membrane protein YqiK